MASVSQRPPPTSRRSGGRSGSVNRMNAFPHFAWYVSEASIPARYARSTVSSPWRVFATTSDPGTNSLLGMRSGPRLRLLHRVVHDRLQSHEGRPVPLFLRDHPDPHRDPPGRAPRTRCGRKNVSLSTDVIIGERP